MHKCLQFPPFWILDVKNLALQYLLQLSASHSHKSDKLLPFNIQHYEFDTAQKKIETVLTDGRTGDYRDEIVTKTVFMVKFLYDTFRIVLSSTTFVR